MKRKYWLWIAASLIFLLAMDLAGVVFYGKGISAKNAITTLISVVLLFTSFASLSELEDKKAVADAANYDKAQRLTVIYFILFLALALVLFLLFSYLKIPVMDTTGAKVFSSLLAAAFIVFSIEAFHLAYVIRKPVFFRLLTAFIILAFMFVIFAITGSFWGNSALKITAAILGAALFFFLVGMMAYSVYLKNRYLLPYQVYKKAYKKEQKDKKAR